MRANIDAAFASRRHIPGVVSVALAAWGLVTQAAPPLAATSAARPEAVGKPAAEEGTRWDELTPALRSALKPLERDWHTLEAPRKQKWIDIATRMPRMSPDEQQRVQTRMSQWAAMTPLQRTQARLQFKEAEQVAPRDRSAQWEVYQALSPDQKRQLADKGTRAADIKKGTPREGGPGGEPQQRAVAESPQQKTNIVPNPQAAARPRAVAPAVVQASPGATTSLVSKQATPPAHQQAGLPKIAGSSNFIDPATLLPKRGPQGAAVTAAVASAPLPRP